MPYSSLGAGDRIRIELLLKGAGAFIAKTKEASGAVKGLAESTALAGEASKSAAKKTFAYQQAVFTLRRMAFYGTLAVGALGIAAVKMGFQFDSAMQNARVAFQGFLPGPQAVNKELHEMYVFAALTPFEFPDIVMATRRLLPFIGNINTTNQVVKALGNSLAAAGTVSGPALTRATLQLAHMASIGRLTGQVLLNLGRDNIPMQKALQTELHLTGDAVRKYVSAGAIDANTAFQALIKYVQTTPGYIGKAAIFSTKTFSGAFSTFKDFVRMAFGTSQQGLFDGATKRLNAVNAAILPLIRGDKPLTITNLAEALDKGLTPKSHILINAFVTLSTALGDVVMYLRWITRAVSFLMNTLNSFISVVHGTHQGTKALGHILGILILLFILSKSVIMGAEFALLLFKATEYVATAATWALTAATWALNTAWMMATGRFIIAQTSIDIVQASLFMLRRFILTSMIPAIWSLTVALLANPLFWIAAVFVAVIAGLVLLYLYWKPFRDLVNDTATWLWKNWQYAGLLFAFLIPGLGIAIYLIGMVVKNWNDVKAAIDAVINSAKTLFNWLMRIVGINTKGGILGGIGNFVLRMTGLAPFVGLGKSILGSFQAGGVMPATGMALVGEHGPEIVHLPMGSRVQPNPNASGVVAAQNAGAGQPIVIQLMLNRKVLEEAVVDLQNRRNARS